MYLLGVVEVRPIFTVALAYNEPANRQVTMIIGHQCICIPEAENNILCPMKLWMNDVIVNIRPKFLTHNLTEEDHAIIPPRNDRYRISLRLQGINFYFTTRKPTIAQFETCPMINLTYMFP